jgi:hypothetical protein
VLETIIVTSVFPLNDVFDMPLDPQPVIITIAVAEVVSIMERHKEKSVREEAESGVISSSGNDS